MITLFEPIIIFLLSFWKLWFTWVYFYFHTHKKEPITRLLIWTFDWLLK